MLYYVSQRLHLMLTLSWKWGLHRIWWGSLQFWLCSMSVPGTFSNQMILSCCNLGDSQHRECPWSPLCNLLKANKLEVKFLYNDSNRDWDTYRQAFEFTHFMKLNVKFDFLQKPGLGPIKLPPKHTAISVGHFMHSPGLSIIDRENEVLAGQSKHL